MPVEITKAVTEGRSVEFAVDVLKGIAGMPEHLYKGLSSDDPAMRGAAFAESMMVVAGATALARSFSQGVKNASTAESMAALDTEIGAKAKVDLNVRKDDVQQYDHFRKPDSKVPGGEWDWQKQAPNGGAVSGSREVATVKAGETLDRYGQRGGEYLSPAGTPYEARALPPGKLADPYEQYPVLKPFTVVKEQIAPAFDQPGLGVQLRAQIPEVQNRFATIDELIRFNYLKDPKK